MRVAPPLGSFSATCFASPSVPGAAWPVALTMCPRASPGTASSGPSRRLSCEFPRLSSPSASPAAQLRVSPKLSSTKSASDASPGIPRYCIFRLCRWGTSGSPRTFLSIGDADWWISGFPRVTHLPAFPSPLPWVTPSPRLRLGQCCLPAFARTLHPRLSCKRFIGCPRFMRPLAVPRMNLQALSGRAIPA